ncbi:hypothetical protein GCM10009727_01800 [Actinomadura napierensis]|uniref:Uncharacterized protein n=1 Tax=Actinomadura napierensis TaxID=267854 RepID=A0ABN2XXF0_9ACTN
MTGGGTRRTILTMSVGNIEKTPPSHLTTVSDPVQRLYFGGSSAAAGPVAAEHADVYLTSGPGAGHTALLPKEGSR